ncbi:LOW QUALITY PROTEIN: charged multivesicular body protein 1b-like [Pipistrellus kuhlii]|uniref:LOW QUALITY PROTEIN: charged multivesicular body protein 1b-like n=1 Tax=Pipistrellus kuhlii TaxID=59472 RepID=UPI00174F7680|nr:LOW QUALITY PROTEIN: charged multivesicular body protein 1b-like [Pipistrellus kuhlii]
MSNTGITRCRALLLDQPCVWFHKTLAINPASLLLDDPEEPIHDGIEVTDAVLTDVLPSSPTLRIQQTSALEANPPYLADLQNGTLISKTARFSSGNLPFRSKGFFKMKKKKKERQPRSFPPPFRACPPGLVKKCDKEEKAEKAKSKKAIQKGNMEVAKIHAENAIRQKTQAVNFLRMSARVDAVAARVQTAVTMGKVTKSTVRVVKSMDATLKTMNLEKISALTDKFEHQFQMLDVQTQQMEDSTMSSTTTLTTPQRQVDMLLQEMAGEARLDLNMELPQGQTHSVGTSVASAEQDELSQRLAHRRDQV